MWYKLLAYSSWGSSLLPLVYFVVVRGLRLNIILKLVLLLQTTSFVTDGVCLLLIKNHISNSVVINFYVSVEFLILLWIYNCFFEREKWKWLFKVLAAGLVLFVTYLLVIRHDFASFSSHLNTVSAIVVVIFSMLAFNRMVGQVQSVTAQYFFWINSAFMLYYLCNLALFLFKAYILGADASYDTSHIWGAHNFFHICSNVLILAGFILWRRQNSSSTSLSGS